MNRSGWGLLVEKQFKITLRGYKYNHDSNHGLTQHERFIRLTLKLMSESVHTKINESVHAKINESSQWAKNMFKS